MKKRIILAVVMVLIPLLSAGALLVNSWRKTPYGNLDAGTAVFLNLVIGKDGCLSQGGTVEEMRKNMAKMTTLLGGSGPDLPLVKNITIPGPAGSIPLRLYSRGDRNPPIVLFFHGGGWALGDLETHDAVCRAITKESGALTVSVDYRRSPEHKFPAAVDDCYAALLYVGSHGKELDGDPSRIAVAGDSAGGNLAAVISQMARDRKGPRIGLQVLIYPGVDFTVQRSANLNESFRNFSKGYFLSMKDIRYFSKAYLRTPEDMLNPLASPALAKSLKGLPPALILSARFDVLYSEGKAYGDKLKAAGVPVRHQVYDGMIHGFINSLRFVPEARAAVREIASELGKVFPSEAAR